MDKNMVLILDDVQRKLEKSNFDSKKKEKLESEIIYLKDKYRNLEIDNDYKEVYESLTKKGKELTREGNFRDAKKVEYYIRYCHAALYDFSGNLKVLNNLSRGYLVTCALFLALAPQYFSYILPLLLLVPIYLGLKGIKKRTLTGLYYGLSVMPMSVLTSVAILRSTYQASQDFNGYINSLAQQINRTPDFVKNLTIVSAVLGVVMLLGSIYTIYLGVKHRKMFI